MYVSNSLAIRKLKRLHVIVSEMDAIEQPIPKVTDRDVERIAIRDFGEARLTQVMAILQEYGMQDWNRPPSPRVRLAILKLANGDVNQLVEHTRVAIRDFRDVLSAAEYPRYAREIGFKNVAKETKRAIIADDWRQYREWFEK
jgi:hypothetical protein